MSSKLRSKLNAFALESGPSMRCLDEPASDHLYTIKAGLREAEIVVLAEPKILEALTSAERHDLEAALALVPTLFRIEADSKPDHIAWIQKHLTAFDRVSAAQDEAALPRSVLSKGTISTASSGAKEMATVNKKPILNLPDAESLTNPFARAIATPDLSLAERKAKYFDCRSALRNAVENALSETEIGGQLPEVLEFGVGLSLDISHENAPFKVFCVESQPDLAALAEDFSNLTIDSLDALDTTMLEKSAVIVLNGWDDQLIAKQPLEHLLTSSYRIILVEHIAATGRIGQETYLTSVLNRLAKLLPDSVLSLHRLRLLGHKPKDFLAETALIEVNVIQ